MTRIAHQHQEAPRFFGFVEETVGVALVAIASFMTLMQFAA